MAASCSSTPCTSWPACALAAPHLVRGGGQHARRLLRQRLQEGRGHVAGGAKGAQDAGQLVQAEALQRARAQPRLCDGAVHLRRQQRRQQPP
jgi:hypothetical protein